MANTYEWDFLGMNTAPTQGSLSDVIKDIDWQLTATCDTRKVAINSQGILEVDDDDNPIKQYPLSGSISGTATITVVDKGNFVDFESITKDWCKTRVLEALGKTEAEMKALADAKLDEIATPPSVKKLPASW